MDDQGPLGAFLIWLRLGRPPKSAFPPDAPAEAPLYSGDVGLEAVMQEIAGKTKKEPTMNYLLPNKYYDAIKVFVTVIMPAASVLYVGLAGIWGWPYADEVSRTIAVIYTFLCAVMGISTYTAKPAIGDTHEFDATDELWGE